MHLFNKKKFKKLLERHEWDHEINLTEEVLKKLNAKAYTMILKKEEALNQWLDEQLKAGLIMESKSRYAAPCFYILKKNSSLQLVQDYRKLNQVTIKDKTPLPLIGEIINKLKEAKYFNKLDLIWGYNNVQIKEGDEWKAVFLTNKGLFELQIMYFRLCNSLVSYASPLIQKLHPHSEVTSKTYKPVFHSSYLSRNMSHGSAATIWVFYLP